MTTVVVIKRCTIKTSLNRMKMKEISENEESTCRQFFLETLDNKEYQ